MSLTDKVALITGASRGIGAATARRLAADGARVAVNYAHGAAAAAGVVAQIREAGGQAEAIQADVADPEAAASLAARVVELWGRLDILVNNAALSSPAPLDEIDPALFHRHFDLNVLGPAILSREAARVMQPGGRIIHLSSGLGSIPAPGNSLYGASKAAIESFTRSHAVELGPRGITVNCVAPGITDTDMLRATVPEDVLPSLVAATPLGRLGRPEDVADVIAFLASDQARWVTGQVIAASGGLR